MKPAKKEKKHIQWTKLLTAIVLFAGIIFIQESYILAFLQREQIAAELSQTVATVIIGSVLGYYLKAYNETKQSKKNELIEKQMGMGMTEECPEEEIVSGEAEEMDESGDSCTSDFPEEF